MGSVHCQLTSLTRRRRGQLRTAVRRRARTRGAAASRTDGTSPWTICPTCLVPGERRRDGNSYGETNRSLRQAEKKHFKHITVAPISKKKFHTRHHQRHIADGSELHWKRLQRVHIHRALVRGIVCSVRIQRPLDRLFAPSVETKQSTHAQKNLSTTFALFSAP